MCSRRAYMAHGLFQHFSGKKGEIRIAGLDALIGTMADWSLKRRGDDGPKEGLYDLRAAFSYLNEHLIADSDYEKQIILWIGKERYIADPEGSPISINGKRMLVQGVKLRNGNDEG
jgi:hypothetical protein